MKAWLLTFILCASTLAQADWMLIQQSGTKPQRAAVFADILSLTDSSSGLKAAGAMLDKNPEALKQLDEHDRRYKPLRLVEVCESQPETRYLSLELDGDLRLYRILDAREFRHDARFLDLTSSGWKKLSDAPWGKAAETFAFHQEPWREALSHVLKTTDQRELQALGYELVHNFSHADLPDLMWKYFWTDGTRPPADENALTLAKIGYVLKLDDKERANGVQALEALQTKLAARPRPQHSEASASADGSVLGSWVGAPACAA